MKKVAKGKANIDNQVDMGAPYTDSAIGAKPIDKPEFEEITLKFGKGCVKDEFQGKDGNTYRSILIPNEDPNDKSPWKTFVVRSNAVHEDKFGNGMWIKLPAEGHTTVRQSVVTEQADGTRSWSNNDTKVTNRELKSMVEFYKERPRESVKEKMAEKKAEVAKAVGKATTKSRALEAAI